MQHDEVIRLYGPWMPRSVTDVARLLAGYPGRWWIAGGWAIEAFTNLPRPHGDIDPSIPRADADLLRAHVVGAYDVWAADRGDLRPLADPSRAVPTRCSNLWLRTSGAAPWEYDVILMDASDDTWTYKRDSRVTLPFEKILWTKGGIDYLRPEIQLLHKAPGLRPQDRLDFDAARPLLSNDSARWLRDALNTAHPGHPWAAALA
ncbi:hypothetical protein ACLD0U_12555 [Microbacterium sp. 2216-1]|uniref:hypothetical protein n=1 Tax=Microbacterium TaxID=33882 RepID=UPI00181BED54